MKSSAAIDLLFPRSCAGCGSRVGEESLYLCWDCITRIPVIRPPFCEICGDPVQGAIDEGYTCSFCKKSAFFDIARSAVHYTGIAQKLIQDFKYNRATWLASDLALLMLTCLKTRLPEFRADIIVSAPLHPLKRRDRTYNQASLLAGKIAACLSLPVSDNLLRRTRQTKSQTHLTAAERKVNVNNVFFVKKNARLNGLEVLLIDDVMTTGATLNDCARALKSAGARKVTALTVARGLAAQHTTTVRKG